MSDAARSAPRRSRTVWLLAAAAAMAVSGGIAYAVLAPRSETGPQLAPMPPAATAEEVHRLCAACHAYPTPDSFPRSAWRGEVMLGFEFFHKDASYRFAYPPLEAVVRYYEDRAPEALPSLPRTSPSQPPVATFERRNLGVADAPGPPGIAFVDLVRLFSPDKPDVLVCDALNNQVLVLGPHEATPAWREIARGLCACHAEVVDLDGDGIRDVVLACLGNFYATDDRVGAVVWLRRSPDGAFTPVTLLDGIGRVADVRAADFTGDGKLDLVVAAFGWHTSGEILLLENQTTDRAKPVFVPRVLDTRDGASHVPVADLNGDGKPDFMALLSQDHEKVVVFLNEGGGRFRQETVYAGPHPAFGLNGLQLVDLDGDGDLDALVTNGDSLDPVKLLKPYHGVRWLENRGSYPFTEHKLTDGYGVGAPVTADFDGNGLLDVAVASFLPAEFFPQRAQQRLDAVLLLEQATPGKFVRHVLEGETCDHLACAAGDLDGDGRPDLVVGTFVRGGRAADALTVWRNTTPKPRQKP